MLKKNKIEQAGAELGQAQLQLELEFTLIKVCCITLMVAQPMSRAGGNNQTLS